MAVGPKPLSEDADETIDDPNVQNEKPDMIIEATKPVPKKVERPPSQDRPPPPPPSGYSTGPSYGSTYGSSSYSQPAAPEAPEVALRRLEIEREIALKDSKIQQESWVKQYWRPAMGWLYMVICFMDFVGFPLMAMFMPVFMKAWGVQMTYTAWQSLTLANGGLIHLAFGAILGVTAFSRGQEKMASMPPRR